MVPRHLRPCVERRTESSWWGEGAAGAGFGYRYQEPWHSAHKTVLLTRLMPGPPQALPACTGGQPPGNNSLEKLRRWRSISRGLQHGRRLMPPITTVNKINCSLLPLVLTSPYISEMMFLGIFVSPDKPAKTTR